MSYRSTPALAIGGVSYLDHKGEATNVSDPTPTGWRCFHCNRHFTGWRAAMRHFGEPGDKSKNLPICKAVE